MRQSGLIHSRRFAPLFLTQFLGAFNDNVFRFALVIFVTFTVAERTGLDTRVLVVLTGAIFILPFFLFSAFAGQVADKYEKAALIRHVKTAEIVVMGLGALGFWLESYPFLLAVLF
ncbi:MAG: glycerol acyltransferase, partial [Gammaproteobacteria bacterium]|nr:glycerol acyltransferase [Gammaproteobacteria bacterium]